MNKIAVGIPCGEIGRYSMFWDSLCHVRGVTHDNILQVRSANVAHNRNIIAEQARQRGFDSIWYVDDDQVFSPNTLERLLSHDVDVVSGLYVQREVPFIPHVYVQDAKSKRIYPRLLQNFDRKLVKADVVGAGCLLVKTKVFEKLEKPWWRLGQVDMVNWSDDTDWCFRVREAGFNIWCDQSCPIGHIMQGVVWPMYQDGTWSTVMFQGQQVVSGWPAAQEKKD